SSSYFLGMMRTTFPRKKVCIKPGAVHPALCGVYAAAVHGASFDGRETGPPVTTTIYVQR
ncbi:hypothetical protein, partial [Mycobacterium intracellulare]|uniref:hypothetical protein n=1 Tax=Mycobacterium intracellulare TaxID=1767 RepID=UPI0019D6DA24